MCSNDRKASVSCLCRTISDVWIIATPPPLSIGRGVCLMQYPFGTMSVITLESREHFNHVWDIAIISSWYQVCGPQWQVFCLCTIER